jgi:glycosyltransferase involved in cell wall biosynthesis
MRIAVIAPPWTPVPPPLYGGVEMVVDRLARGFQDADHEVLLYTVSESTCPVPKRWVLEEAEGQRIGKTAPELRHVMNAYEAVQDFDVIHDHTTLGPFYAERFPHLKIATTAHNQLGAEGIDIYTRLPHQVALITVSAAQARSAPNVRVTRVIHHGIDVTDFPFGAGDGDYCLFLGRMAATKGVHLAIDAAQRAGVPLRMVAKMRDEREHAYFESYVKPRLGNGVEYLGEVPHEHKLELLAGAQALLFPIRWNEPFGLVMIEALACGTPVLAFPEGAAPEVVNHGRTGFLCEDETAMAEALLKVDTIDRSVCRAEVENRFSVERMVREHLELFESMLAR